MVSAITWDGVTHGAFFPIVGKIWGNDVHGDCLTQLVYSVDIMTFTAFMAPNLRGSGNSWPESYVWLFWASFSNLLYHSMLSKSYFRSFFELRPWFSTAIAYISKGLGYALTVPGRILARFPRKFARSATWVPI